MKQSYQMNKQRPGSILRSVIIVAACLAFLFFFKIDTIASRPRNEIFNFGHLPLFGIISLALLRLLNHGQWPVSQKKFYILAGISTILLGFITESMQLFIPDRSFSAKDLFCDSLGAVAFLTFVYPFPARLKKIKLASKATCIVLIAAAMAPIVPAIADFQQMQKDFPLICSFETGPELSRWQERNCTTTLSPMHATHGKSSIKVDFKSGKYSGLITRYFVHNWQGHVEFLFDAFLTGDKPLIIVVNISDRKHQRMWNEAYHKRFILRPGINHISVDLKDIIMAPKSRVMEVSNIDRIYFLTYKLQEARTLYIDNIRLSRN